MNLILLIFAAISFGVFAVGMSEKEGFLAIVGACMLFLCLFVLIYADDAEEEAVIKVLNKEIKVDTLAVTKDGKIVDIKLLD